MRHGRVKAAHSGAAPWCRRPPAPPPPKTTGRPCAGRTARPLRPPAPHPVPPTPPLRWRPSSSTATARRERHGGSGTVGRGQSAHGQRTHPLRPRCPLQTPPATRLLSGVILESEDLHRLAYNAAFAHFDVKIGGTRVVWTEEFYDDLQNKVGGGKPKMRWYFGHEGWPSSSLGPAPGDKAGQEALVDALQAWKTDEYQRMIGGTWIVLSFAVAREAEERLGWVWDWGVAAAPRGGRVRGRPVRPPRADCPHFPPLTPPCPTNHILIPPSHPPTPFSSSLGRRGRPPGCAAPDGRGARGRPEAGRLLGGDQRVGGVCTQIIAGGGPVRGERRRGGRGLKGGGPRPRVGVGRGGLVWSACEAGGPHPLSNHPSSCPSTLRLWMCFWRATMFPPKNRTP